MHRDPEHLQQCLAFWREFIQSYQVNTIVTFGVCAAWFTGQLFPGHPLGTTPRSIRMKDLPGEGTRYVFDHEFTAIYQIASPSNQVMMDLATITRQREGDLLKLPNRDPTVYTDDGIVFRPGKSKRRHPRHGAMVESAKTVIVEWSPELRDVIDRARKLGPDIRRTLICNLQGKPFTESGFRSNWHRLIQAGLKGRKKSNGEVALAPVIKESFTFHDLRAKSGSDAEDVQEANDRLAHDDLRTTQVVYRRKPRRARAGRKVGT